MNTIALTLSAAALALAGGSAALADNHAKPAPAGPTTVAELRNQAAAAFDRMDVNSDGVIDATDRAAAQAQRFAAMDTNNDGVVTLAEMQAAAQARSNRRAAGQQAPSAERRAAMDERLAARFAQLDTDNSGSLTLEEFTAPRQPRAERGERPHRADRAERSGTRGDRAEQRGKRGDRMARGGYGMGQMILRMADTNNDGTVTRAEFDTAVEAHIARLDTDGDGIITAEERQAAHAQMRTQMRERMQQRRAGQAQQ